MPSVTVRASSQLPDWIPKLSQNPCVIAEKLRAFVYAGCHNCKKPADAISYRARFNERELMLVWLTSSPITPKSGAMRSSRLRRTPAVYVHVLTTNRAGINRCPTPVRNVLGISARCSGPFSPEDSDANNLNNKEITTIICRNGFRFWATVRRKRRRISLRCTREPLRCWLIPLRKRSLKRLMPQG